MLNIHENKRINLSPPQIIVGGFALVIFIGTILLNLPISSTRGESIGFVDALFTATSAVCVTGLVVVDTGTYWTTFGKTIILLLIQIGGLGFMTLATLGALIIGKKISLKERLLIQESLNQNKLSGIVNFTRQIIFTTFFIESIGAFFLAIVFVPEFGFLKGIGYSIFHSISAFCNAGFDIIGGGRSLTPYVNNTLINLTIMSLTILGGLGFTVISDIATKRKFKRLSLHSKIVLFVSAILILVPFILFFFMEYSNEGTIKELSLKGKLLASLFQAVTPRTAGFNTIDLAGMQNSSKLLTTVLMFIGGSPASTAGGIKISTLAVLILAVRTLITGKDDVYAFKRKISYSSVNKALAVLFVGLSVIISGTMILSLTEPSKEFLYVLFETVSAFGTVGLSLGITGELSVFGRLVVILIMFTGRVGALTILLALATKEKKVLYKFPEDKVIVG